MSYRYIVKYKDAHTLVENTVGCNKYKIDYQEPGHCRCITLDNTSYFVDGQVLIIDNIKNDSSVISTDEYAVGK